MRTVDLLRQLQELDSRIDTARTLITQLSTKLGDRQMLAKRETEVSAVRAELHGLEAQQRDLELQAEERRARE